MYATLKLENHYNISEYLDIQEYTENINSYFDNLNLTIDNVVLLDDAGRRSLMDFISSGVDGINYDAYLAEVRLPRSCLNFWGKLERGYVFLFLFLFVTETKFT